MMTDKSMDAKLNNLYEFVWRKTDQAVCAVTNLADSLGNDLPTISDKIMITITAPLWFPLMLVFLWLSEIGKD